MYEILEGSMGRDTHAVAVRFQLTSQSYKGLNVACTGQRQVGDGVGNVKSDDA